MCKLLALFGLASLLATTAQAQTTPALPTGPEVPPTAVRPPNPATDSAQAVRTLFRKRRNGGTVYTSIGSLVLLRGVLFSGSADELVASGVIAAPFIAVGISKLSRFGNKKEEQYIKQYQQGKPLPRFIRRRLQPDFFRQAEK
jgi:hypothetical protein